MKLQFLSQIIEDFKAFEGQHEFRWNFPGVTFICGDNRVNPRLAGNGSGKSSLFDALCWCLFGRTPSGLKNPDVMPWSGSGKPRVKVAIDIDGKERWVERSISPNKLLLDEVEASQDRLEEVLGLNFELFTNTILLAQGQDLFYDVTPQNKMALFADTLQLERWDARAKAAADDANVAFSESVGIRADLLANETAATELEAQLESTKLRAEAWVTEHRIAVREAEKKIAGLQKEFDAKDKQWITATLAEDSAATEYLASVRVMKKVNDDLSEKRRARNKIEAEADAGIQQVTRELASIKTAKNCPTCGQPIKGKDVTEHKAHLTEKLEQLQAARKNAVPVDLLSSERALLKQADKLLTEAEGFETARDAALTTVRRLEREKATLEAQLTEAKRVAKAEATNPHTAQIASLQTRLKALKVEHVELTTELTEATRAVEKNKFWAKGFKDIKLQLIADVLDELELATNSMLEEVGLGTWEIHYDIERETKSGTVQRALSVLINSPESKGFVKWESWSGGEQQRLRLVGALALADVLLNYAGLQSNLEILDEPAVYWSSEGVQELCAFLAERARATDRSIYYVEHSAVSSVHFAQTLMVVRDKGGSYVEEQ